MGAEGSVSSIESISKVQPFSSVTTTEYVPAPKPETSSSEENIDPPVYSLKSIPRVWYNPLAE